MKPRSVNLLFALFFITVLLFESNLSAQLFRRSECRLKIGRCIQIPRMVGRIHQNECCLGPCYSWDPIPVPTCATTNCTVKKGGDGHFYVELPNECGEFANCRCAINMKSGPTTYQCYQNSSSTNLVTIKFDTKYDGSNKLDAEDKVLTQTSQFFASEIVENYLFKQKISGVVKWKMEIDYIPPSGPISLPPVEDVPDEPNYEYVTVNYQGRKMTKRFSSGGTDSKTFSFAGFTINIKLD